MDQRLLIMHQMMLADRTRMGAYDRAIEQVVGPGDIVVDAGAGSLALAMLALRHGAGHVYAVEADPEAAAMAERIIQSNDLKGRITLIEGDARVVRLPSAADVVLAEMMGNLGPEENMMDVLAAVAKHNLCDGGRILPGRLDTKVAAIEFDEEGWGIWGEDYLGYRLDSVRDLAEPQPQLHFFQRQPRLLAEPAAILTETAGDRTPPGTRMRQRLRVTEPGRLHAVIGYFTAELVDGVTLANFPSYPGCNWAVWVWPLRHIRVNAGDEIDVELHRPADRRNSRLSTEWRLDCHITRRGGS
jgi:SAM-dependent methyltransferase